MIRVDIMLTESTYPPLPKPVPYSLKEDEIKEDEIKTFFHVIQNFPINGILNDII
jgi:hypothetical protein